MPEQESTRRRSVRLKSDWPTKPRVLLNGVDAPRLPAPPTAPLGSELCPRCGFYVARGSDHALTCPGFAAICGLYLYVQVPFDL